MPYSSGTYSLPSNSFAVPVTGTTISSSAASSTFADFVTAFSTCVLKDGTQTITANLPMSSFKLTGLAAGSATGDSLRYEQLFTAGTVTLLGQLLGPATMLSPITNSLGGDVNLTNAATYFDGPSVAQGTAGTWYASGTVTVDDTNAGGGNINVKLWDGTTVIASTYFQMTAAGVVTLSVSGFITTPAANIRISVKNTSNTSNTHIKFNQSGNSKDSTVTAIRIA